MKDYYVDESRELALVKLVRKTTKKWIICNILAVIFGVVGVVGAVLMAIYSGSHGGELVCVIVAVLLFPVIGVLISAAVARTGGRDILLARYGEKVVLSDEEIVESYVPKFSEIDKSSLAENHIAYTGIKRIVHEKRKFRYVIYGVNITVKYGRTATERSTSNNENGKMVLYDYFQDMKGMLQELQQRSGIIIEEED